MMNIAWPEVVAVGIRTTADGPFAEDVFWQFLMPRGRLVEVPGTELVFDDLRQLPGVDYAKVTRAMGSTDDRWFRVWHREESTFCPDLAVRFAAMVGRVGGDPEAAPAIFERVHAAWRAKHRCYHGVEHLIDCLRELDQANVRVPTADVVELALWYHDLVYEPRLVDCEEKSARALLADAVQLAIPEATARVAADAVRATAHDGGGSLDAVAELVVDIDLAILGRDPLRFLDYEYSIEEEYTPVTTIAFRRARGRFLAALLARDHIYRTEAFRDRYEARARAQLAGLLASPRYRSYRWLRWIPM